MRDRINAAFASSSLRATIVVLALLLVGYAGPARADLLDKINGVMESGICPKNTGRYKLQDSRKTCPNPHCNGDYHCNVRWSKCQDRTGRTNAAINRYNSFMAQCERTKAGPPATKTAKPKPPSNKTVKSAPTGEGGSKLVDAPAKAKPDGGPSPVTRFGPAGGATNPSVQSGDGGSNRPGAAPMAQAPPTPDTQQQTGMAGCPTLEPACEGPGRASSRECCTSMAEFSSLCSTVAGAIIDGTSPAPKSELPKVQMCASCAARYLGLFCQ